MSNIWLYLNDDSSSTLELDNELNELTLGGNKRRYKFLDYAGQSGAAVRGFGSFGKKTFLATRTETIETGDTWAWNSKRGDFMKHFTVPAYKIQYLYITDGESSITARTRVYVQEIPPDKYKNYRLSEKRTFKIVSPSGVFENTTATTGSQVLADNSEYQVTLTNNGYIECPMTIEYTPTGAETEFRVKIAEGYGVRLGGSFEAGVKVSFDMKTGKLTLGGAEVNAADYISAGSEFQILPGSVTSFVKASGAGTFEYSFNQRYI